LITNRSSSSDDNDENKKNDASMSINISRINIEEKKFSYFSRKKNYYRQKMKM